VRYLSYEFLVIHTEHFTRASVESLMMSATSLLLFVSEIDRFSMTFSSSPLSILPNGAWLSPQ
jgi:hypothetical protein